MQALICRRIARGLGFSLAPPGCRAYLGRLRLRRAIKYEEVYLRAYDSASAALESLRRYLKFYNTETALRGEGQPLQLLPQHGFCLAQADE